MGKQYIPGEYGQAEYTEKRSRFIGQVWRVASEQEAQKYIALTREKYYDATHNVHAFILKSGASRCSDDGEPKGTAGMPVLEVFRKSGVSDVCCVVTRYFGGILLGAGGLARAYGKTAALALEAAGIYLMKMWTAVRFRCGYALFELARQSFISLGGEVKETSFGSDVIVTGLLPEGAENALTEALLNLSSGRIEPEFIGTAELPVRAGGSD